MRFDEYIGMTGWGEDGPSSARLKVEPHHCNPTGAINGGVLVSMADNVSTGAANQAYFEKTGERKFMVGVDLHAVFLSNQEGGTLVAIPETVRVGRRVTVIRTRVVGDGGKVLCEVTTTHVPT